MTITGLTAEKITSFEKITDEFKDSIVSINLELASVTEELVKVAGEEVAYDSSSLVLIAEDGTLRIFQLSLVWFLFFLVF